jgi:hypothetical protein
VISAGAQLWSSGIGQIGITAGGLVLAGLVGWLVKLIPEQNKKINEVKSDTDKIHQQLVSNGGSSLRDAIHRIEKMLEKTNEKINGQGEKLGDHIEQWRYDRDRIDRAVEQLRSDRRE